MLLIFVASVSSKTFQCEFEGTSCILRNERFLTILEPAEFSGYSVQKQRVNNLRFVECEIDLIPSYLFSIFPKLNEVNIEMSKVSTRNMNMLVRHLKPIKKLEIGGERNLVLENSSFQHLENLEELVLVVLFLDFLPARIFEKNKKLRYIHLGKNNIKTLDENLLAELENLETFIISRNQLENLPIILFKNNRNLKHINLAWNQIDKINENLFQNSQRLESVYLEGNQLEILPKKLFWNNKNLKIVDLHSNRLRMFSSSLFNGLNSLKKLDLAGNQCIDKQYRRRAELETLRDDLEICNQNCLNFKKICK